MVRVVTAVGGTVPSIAVKLTSYSPLVTISTRQESTQLISVELSSGVRLIATSYSGVGSSFRILDFPFGRVSNSQPQLEPCF